MSSGRRNSRHPEPTAGLPPALQRTTSCPLQRSENLSETTVPWQCQASCVTVTASIDSSLLLQHALSTGDISPASDGDLFGSVSFLVYAVGAKTCRAGDVFCTVNASFFPLSPGSRTCAVSADTSRRWDICQCGVPGNLGLPLAEAVLVPGAWLGHAPRAYLSTVWA